MRSSICAFVMVGRKSTFQARMKDARYAERLGVSRREAVHTAVSI